MADHEPTTLNLPPREPRALVIPHILSPEELAGLLRIGEALADIQERLAAVMGRPGGPIASELQDLALLTIDLLDVVEPDPDLEPSLAGLNCAPGLGAGWWDGHDRNSDQTHWAEGACHDGEEEHDGREPSLCGLAYGPGDDRDLEGEHCGLEPDEDDAEPWHNPPRLDVFAEPFKASFDFLSTTVIEGAAHD